MLEYRTDFALKPVGIGGVFFWIEAKCEIIIWRADRAYRFAEGVIREVGFKTDVQIVVAEKTYAETMKKLGVPESIIKEKLKVLRVEFSYDLILLGFVLN